uniref:LLGL scribble cell polarity complex component 2 n=1 Tax=Neolamprologus brichardi TaxID=32507 RepID=A0A3Q4NAS5_NEOBR
MKRFRRHGQESQRDRIKQELFAFNKVSKLDHTTQYGAPGVEFMGLHDENAAVTQAHFMPHQVELVTLLDDNSLHMWTLRGHNGLSELLEIGLCSLQVFKKVLLLNCCHTVSVLGSNVLKVTFPTLLSIIEYIACHPLVPDDYIGRRNLEHVEALQENPVDPDQVIIGYGRGLMVIWDLEKKLAIQHIPATQQLESVCWTDDGKYILSSHSDGSYCRWMVGGEDTNEEEKSDIPYGHFPCKAISKIVQLPTEEGPPFLLFSGGMPRASYGDRHCITVIHGKKHVALDFTSRIIDFFVIRDGPQHTGRPHTPTNWQQNYSTFKYGTLKMMVEDIKFSYCFLTNFLSSCQPWPVTGGQNLAPDPPQRDLLLTGHEDGTVRFWDASGVCLYPMYKLSTAGVFHTDADPNDNMNQGTEGEWPPFRKVGCFDPYSDDPRLGIQKIHLCKYSGYLTVAGTAGQILMLELNDEAAEQTVEAKVVDLLQGQEGFRWKVENRTDYSLCLFIFLQSKQSICAAVCISYVLILCFQTFRCTLNPSDQLAMEGPLSRVKSIKKSLRQSFRRIRRSRVSLRKQHLQEANARLEAELAEMELAPVQRKIEARSSDDSFTGLVRTLYFADTFLSDSSHNTPSLWAGTNGGCVFAYMLRLPSVEHRADETVTAQLSKEIQLMHRAPVVGIVVLDGHGAPLPEPLEVAHDLARAPDMQGSHHLLVVSEEQFKVFTLPKVSAKMKLKLTAVDGSRVRRVGMAWFGSSRTEDYGESGLLVLTNQGDVHVVSLPHVKMQVHYPCIRREDVSGIASCVFTKHGQGFYLISPSEFERFSLSTCCVVEPRCLVEAPLHSGCSNQHQSQPDGHALLNDESEYSSYKGRRIS